MTENEAREILTLSSDMKKELPNLQEVYAVAVKALEEIQQYRSIGTVLECQIAMEKQTPYKITYKNGFGHCKCGCEFEREGYEGEEYCPECGQKVWVGGYSGEGKVVSFGEARKPEKIAERGSLWTKRH